MASDKAAATRGSVGQQALGLMRSLVINGLLVAVPVVAYYYAVVERQSRARTELGLNALKRVQQEFDTRLVRLDTLMRGVESASSGPPAPAAAAPAFVPPAPAASFAKLEAKSKAGTKAGTETELSPPAYIKDRFAELGVWLSESPGNPCVGSSAGKVVSVFALDERSGHGVVHGARCSAGKALSHLEIEVASLLDAGSALSTFEKVDLVNDRGEVIASAAPRLASDPDRLAHPVVSSALSPTSLKPYLIQAVRERQQRLATPGQKIDDKAEAADAGEPAVIKATLSDRRYRIYLLPFRAEKSVTQWLAGKQADQPIPVLYLVGIQPQSTLDEASNALGSSGLWYLTLAVLLMSAAWPLLRVLLLSDHEAVSRPSLATTVISLLFVPALLSIALLAFGARGQTLHEWDVRAKGYGEDIDRSLQRQIGELLAEIDRHAPLYVQPAKERDRIASGLVSGQRMPTVASPGGEPPQALQCRGVDLVPGREAGQWAACDIKSQEYCHLVPGFEASTPSLRPATVLDGVFYASADGLLQDDAYLTNNGCQPRLKTINLASREYFKTLARERGWPLPFPAPGTAVATAIPPVAGTALERARHFVVQRIYSRADGSRTLLVAIPRRDEQGNFAGIFAASSALRSLAAAIRPPLLGFAVIDDQSGTVLFHSNDDNSLQENFISEIGSGSELATALRARASETLSAGYHGNDHRFTVRPIEGLPWTVVTFYDIDQVTTPVYSAAILSALAYIGYILAMAVLVAIVIVLLVMFGTRGRWQPQSWQWLWPQWRLRRSYQRIAGLLTLLVMLELVLWTRLPTDVMLGLVMIAVVVACAAATVLLVPHRAAGQPQPGRSGTAATSPSATLPEGLRGRWLDGRGAARSEVDTLAEFRGIYLVCAMLCLMAAGAIPASGLFLHAWPWMAEATLRAGLLDSASSFEQRVARTVRDQRRNAHPGMARIGQYRSADALARIEPAPGFVSEAQGQVLKLALPEASTLRRCPEPADCQAPQAMAPLLARLWASLGPLLPRQQEAIRTLDAGGAIQRLNSDEPLRFTWRGHFDSGIEFQYQRPIPAYYVGDLLGAGGALLASLGPNDPRIPLAGGLALVLLLIGVSVGLVLLVEVRVLGINVPFTPPTPSLGADYDRLAAAVAPVEQVTAQWWYLLAGPGGQVPAFRDIEQQFETPERCLLVDLGQSLTMPPSVSADTAILLTNFSRTALNPEARPLLLGLLEQLIALRPGILLLTAMTPPWPRLCQPEDFPGAAAGAGADLPDAREMTRWRAIHARFATHHLPEPIRHDPPAAATAEPAPAYRPATADRHLSRQLQDEEIALSEVLGKPAPSLVASWQREQARDLKDFEDLALNLVGAQLQREWAYCSIAERLALHQMAHGLVPNPLNRRVLDDLLLRRLAILAPEPQIASSTFRRFVLNAETADQYAQWGAQKGAGAWATIRVPFFITLMLLVAWFVYSFGELFTTVNAVMGATLGVLATVGQASKYVSGGSPDK